MEINITPATPAQDQSADIAFPSTTSFTLTPLSPKQHDDPPPPTAKSSSSSTSTTKPITPITISATLSDIAAAIDNVRGLFFQIQEQRHLQSFSTVTTTSSNQHHQPQQDNGRLSPPASATTSSSRTGGPPPTQTSELDKSLIQLDSQLEQVSQSMLIAESQVDTLLKSSSADQDDDGQQQPDYLRNLTRTRRDSRTSLSSLASFDDALLQTGSSTHASYAPALTPAQVQSRFQDLQQDWASVTTDADMLKRELSEDKYLLVFRSVSDQADNMMASLHKAITLSQEFINAFRTSQQYLQSQQTQMGTSGSRLSLDGNDQLSPESQLEELRALKKTFNVKTSYYGPACEQVFHVLERGIKDKATSNGTILHRYADLKMRWKTTREGILRTDRDLTKIERHLCKCLGVGGADLPPYSAEVQQHFGGAGVGIGVSSPARGRQDSAASAASTPPRLQPKSSQRTLRHMHSSGTSASQSIGDGSFTLASPSSTRSGDVGLSPPAPAKPPRSELRRAPSSSRLASSTNGGVGAIPIPGRNPVASNNNNRPSQQQALSSSMGNNGRTGMPHRRSISASVNEPMSDVSYRRTSILSTSQQQQQQQHSTDRPPIPPRGGSRAGARTPLGTSSSGAIHNPFKHTGSEYSYSALTSGRNLGGSGTGVGVSPRRAHSPTHPPSSYRLPGGQAQAQAQVVPRRSKTPQPLGQSGGGAGAGRYAERGSSEPPESSYGAPRPGSRASASGRIGSGTGTIRAAPGGRGRADSRAFDDAMEDLSVESFDGITRSVAAASAAPSATGGRGMRQRPASSMAGYYYHPPSAHGQQPTDSHIPRLAVDASSQSGQSGNGNGNGNGRSPATSLSSLPARPGSSMSQTSSSTTGFASRARMGSSGFPSRGGAGPSRMSMQTPEPVLAAQVKRLSMFARPSSMSQQQQHNQSTSLLQQQQANAYGGSGVAAAVRKSSRPPPARLNNPSRTGRTTPLSAAALAAVPQANPALAWMRDVSSTGGGGGGGVGGPNGGTSPSQSTSSVAAYRAQRAAAASSSASAANSSFNNNGGTNARAETPLSESSFGGQSVGGWGVRPSAANARAAAGMMSSATGGARGGAGSFDVYIPNARDALDVAVAEVVNALGVAIERVDESLPRGVRSEVAPGKDLQARYSIAGKTVACKLLMLHRPAGAAGTRTNVKKLLVRVGGGWQDFEGWISSSILGHLDY
ncbi:hypothetical protein A4X09_0g1204 [Tilletia walkeri]|uniref:GAR domain-containing protein n=1 Tax=Tilletia walkeri TaxID=117179 RepID=A0A8X7NEN8_9BASI|nr:hypothetical protein A4X09_0g1204 [Tilletia walkeri]